MERILCISECCCDLIFGGMPKLPGLGQEVFGDCFAVKAGGGANTPVNLARLGAEVSFLTAVGADPLGELVLRELTDSGVKLMEGTRKEGCQTAVSAVMSTPEDRSFASYGGTYGPFVTREQLSRGIREAEIVHSYLCYCRAYPIVELCRQYGRRLSLDASFCDRENTRENRAILENCHYLKVGREEALSLTGAATPEEALSILAETVQEFAVVTLGAEGSLGMAHGADRSFRLPAAPAEFRDACGAGDAYAAGLLLGISAGKDLRISMMLGAVTAAACVGWYGGNSRMLNCTMLRNRFREFHRKCGETIAI